MMHITIAGIAIIWECANIAGNAVIMPISPLLLSYVKYRRYELQTAASIKPILLVPHASQIAGNKRKRTIDLPIPIVTKNPVTNFPKSITAFPPPSLPKSSGFAHRPQIQFGSGASTYVATTRRGKYWFHSAQERITRRKPTARTWGRKR